MLRQLEAEAKNVFTEVVEPLGGIGTQPSEANLERLQERVAPLGAKLKTVPPLKPEEVAAELAKLPKEEPHK